MKQELEQAAKQWHGTHGIYASDGINKTIVEAFKAGAEWQKEQDDTMFDASLKRFADTNYELGYKAGAEWQKKQGAKGYVIESASSVTIKYKNQRIITLLYDETEDNYVQAGDKVIVQIRKL